MLRGLSVRNILIIDHLELEFQPGLNVLTGETGAGKSILLDCLGFVLGWRGRAELVRQGAEQGEVVAWFDLPADHPVNEILKDSGIEPEDELILRRINNRDGRKTAFVNDRRCSGQVLRQISETLLELHGQHDDRGDLDDLAGRWRHILVLAEEMHERCVDDQRQRDERKQAVDRGEGDIERDIAVREVAVDIGRGAAR